MNEIPDKGGDKGLKARLEECLSADGEDRDAGSRRSAILLGCVLLLAFALRLFYLFKIRSNPWFDNPQMDALYHTEWARAFAAGKTFQEGPFFRAPLYPWFLGLCFRIFGENFFIPRLIQTSFGTLSAALCYLIGRDAFSRRTGILAAFLVATSPVLVYFDGELLIPTLAIPLNLAALWLTLRAAREGTPGGTLLAGAAWGTAAIARPNVLLFMPFLALWFLLERRRRPRAALLLVASLTTGVLLPILPLTAHNYFVGGDRVLIASQGGVNFWIGNNPLSDGTTAIVPGTKDDWWGGYRGSIAIAEKERGRALKPSEVSQHYAGKAWAFIRDNPRRAARHFLWKARLFVTDWELGNNRSIHFFIDRFAPFLNWLPSQFSLLLPLGLAGVLLGFRRGMRRFPLWGFLLVYSASVILFFVCSRFRAPVLPLLAVYAAHGLLMATSFFRKRCYPLLAATVTLCLLILIPVRMIPASIDRSDALGLRNLALNEYALGRRDEAAELLRRAVEERPTFVYGHRDLGILLAASGRITEAEFHLGEALRLKPDEAGAMEKLLELYLAGGKSAEAGLLAAKAIETFPAFAFAYYYHGRASLETGRFDEAERSLATALERDPSCFPCALFLAQAVFRQGEWQRAAEHYLAALAIHRGGENDPALWQAYAGLVRSLVAGGKEEEARALARQIRERSGGAGGLGRYLETILTP